MPSTRVLRTLFLASLLVPIALSLALAMAFGEQGPAYTILYTLLIVYAGAGYALIPALARRGTVANVFLSLAVLHVLLLTPEMVLRQRGFRAEPGVQFGYPRPAQFESFVPDAVLFWKLPPGENGANAMGFRGPAPAIPKPPDIHRLLVLGDSVPRLYPAILELFLDTGPSTRPRVEVLNLSLEGYSSHQGRVLTDRYGALLEPDLVLVSYGWNDHWQAYGSADSSKRVDPDVSVSDRAVRVLMRQMRTLQWLGALRASEPLSIPRVSLAEYRENLTYIGAFFAARGVPAVFVTPPTAHDVLGVPDYLVDMGFARDKTSVVRLHRAYNDVVRDVASQHGWPLLDLAADPLTPERARAMFIADGIHLTPGGAAVVARRIAEFVAARPELPSSGRD